MSGFEAFDIRAWLIDELFTRHIEVSANKAKPRRQPRTPTRVQFVLPLVGAAVALQLIASPAVAQEYARTEPASLFESSSSNDSDLVEGDPKVYWSGLIQDLKSRPRATESTMPDPDPLF
jgi:hypothetical protein